MGPRGGGLDRGTNTAQTAAAGNESRRKMNKDLTRYERDVAKEIEVWRAKPPSPGAKVFGKLTGFLDRPTEFVMDKTALGRVLQGVLEVAMDAGSWAVPEERIFKAYAGRGYEITTIDEIRTTVRLEDRDRVAAGLAKWYRVQAGTEGAGAGLGGLGGPAVGAGALVADVAFITAWACRAAAHHAAVYGYRTETPVERMMAMQVLTGATSPTDASKQATLAELIKLSKQIAQKKTWEELEKNAFVKVLREAAEKLGLRLTKAKLGQIVAIVGVVIGGGYNAWYISRVCEWAYFTYRSHYLEDKRLGFPESERDEADSIPEAEVVEGGPTAGP